MLRLNGKTILLGGFHDHWSRAGGHNSSLLLASLSYYHYDFLTLMDGGAADRIHLETAGRLSNRIRLYPGREEAFGWGHVVTVNPRAPKIGTDDGDYESTFRRLKETCDLVILAHPEYPGTWEKLVKTGEMDRLLDEGAMDGINLINTRGFDGPRLRELIAWFSKRDSQGLLTPIVNGWDAHLVLPRRDLPRVLYTDVFSPRGHLDTGGTNRSILFCEENSLPSIVDAVRKGQTVIEDLMTGELVGPKELVDFLNCSDYAGAIARLDKIREAVRLTVSIPWTANEESQFTVSADGLLKVAVPTHTGLQAARISDAASHHPCIFTPPDDAKGFAGKSDQALAVNWPAPPDSINKDYAAVTLQTLDGIERTWAVETQHPIQLELLASYRDGTPGVEFRALRPFDGNVVIEVEGLLNWIGPMSSDLWLPVKEVSTENFLRKARWRAELPNGLCREEETLLTFITASTFGGDWEHVPVYPVADHRFVPESAYGLGRLYPGPDSFAVYLQFAWDETAFQVRARVRDPIHYQPQHGHYVYNADCLQMGFDPILRRAPSVGHIYSFNLALTPAGPELYRWLAPTEETVPGFVCPEDDVSLGANHLKIEPCEGGLIYTLSLPWSELAPATPKRGARIGTYIIAMNNNGEGLIDTLHWPLHFRGMWVVPNRWGLINLI